MPTSNSSKTQANRCASHIGYFNNSANSRKVIVEFISTGGEIKISVITNLKIKVKIELF